MGYTDCRTNDSTRRHRVDAPASIGLIDKPGLSTQNVERLVTAGETLTPLWLSSRSHSAQANGTCAEILHELPCVSPAPCSPLVARSRADDPPRCKRQEFDGNADRSFGGGIDGDEAAGSLPCPGLAQGLRHGGYRRGAG
jgi:hypothetical protein